MLPKVILLVENRFLKTVFALFSLVWSVTSTIVSVPYAVFIDLAILFVFLLEMDIIGKGFRINSLFSRMSIPFLSCIGAFYMSRVTNTLISLVSSVDVAEFWSSFLSLLAIFVVPLVGGLISFEPILRSSFSDEKGPFFQYLRGIEKNFYHGKRLKVTQGQAFDELSKIFMALTLLLSIIVFLLIDFSFSIAIVSAVWIMYDLLLLRTGKTRRTFLKVLSRDVSTFFLIPFYYATKNLRATMIVIYLLLSFFNIFLFALVVNVSSLLAQLVFSPMLIYHLYFGIQLMKRLKYSTIEDSSTSLGLIPGLLYGDFVPIVICQSLLSTLLTSSVIYNLSTGSSAIEANMVLYLPLTILTVVMLSLFCARPRLGGVREVKWDLLRAAVIGVSGISIVLVIMPYPLGVVFMIIAALILLLPTLQKRSEADHVLGMRREYLLNV
jgi:hypothetical protein